MTEPEQPDTPTPPLTRKQLRELRNTGATPVISVEEIEAARQDATAEPVEHVEPEVVEPEAPAPAPLPRAADPVVVPAAPIADSAVDLGVSPLTRRQARQQERIRTASVPVITPDVAAAHAAAATSVVTEVPAPIDAVPTTEAPAKDADPIDDLFAPPVEAPGDDVEVLEVVEEAPDEQTDADDTTVDASAEVVEVDDAVEAATEDDEVVPAAEEDDTAPSDDEDELAALVADEDADDAESEERAVVNPALGEGLITGAPVEIDLPPSFDQLLAHGSTGSIGMPNALILSQTTGDLPIVSPVTSTGEVIVTGTFNLPEGLGSTGHALGTADGKEVDAVLIDGELPAHSSPTPIAASAAISTVKSAGEVIKPPAPEKGGRLMMWLAITAGALALALVGVLILAVVNGVF